MPTYDETYVTFDYDTLWSDFEGQEKNIVCLSDRDISIILSALRVASWPSRWFGADRYNLKKSGRLADLESGLSYIERLESNLMSSCGEDIRAGLEAIANAILNKVCCATGGPGTVGGPGTGGAGGSASTPIGDIEPDVGDPPTGYESWAAYHADVCDKAWWLLNTISADLANMSTLQFAGATAISILPLLAAMLLDPIPGDELFLLAGLLITIAFYGATTLNQIRSSLEDCKADMVCEIYAAAGPESGKDAALTVFRTQIESDTADIVVVEYGVQLMSLMLSWDGLNQVYEYQSGRTYPAGESDCQECIEPEYDYYIGYTGSASAETEWIGWDGSDTTFERSYTIDAGQALICSIGFFESDKVTHVGAYYQALTLPHQYGNGVVYPVSGSWYYVGNQLAQLQGWTIAHYGTPPGSSDTIEFRVSLTDWT